ncbi:MAG: hypothetical protein V1837_07275 [Candidatus Woesearchaeota archaeon]
MVSKRGDSYTVLYCAVVVLVGLIVIFGFRSIVQLNQSAQDVKVLQFITSLDEDAQTMSAKLGALMQSTYSLPGVVKEVCFADLLASPESIGSVDIGNYPFIKRSVESGSGKNVFLVGDKFFGSYSVPSLNLGDGVMFACLNAEGKVLSVALRDSAKGTVLVKGWRVERNLSSSANTDIVSADGSATLSVLAGSSASPTLSIEVIPHPGYNFLSEAYRFGPSGTVFTDHVILAVNFDPTICPPGPDEYVFRLFDDNNQFVEDIKYDSVDCVNHVMTFKLDHFSWGAIAAVQEAQYTFNVVINNGGTVMATVGGNIVPLPLTADFGTVVHLVAGPNFVGWSTIPAGAPFSSANTFYQTLTATGTIYANFRASQTVQPQKGEWYGIMQSAYKMDQDVQIRAPDGTWAAAGQGFGYGCHPTPGICSPDMVWIYPGQTLYFLIDINYSKSWSWNPDYWKYCEGNYVTVNIYDYNQRHTAGYYGVDLIAVDVYGSEIPLPYKPYFGSAGNGVFQGYIGTSQHSSGRLYILKIHSLLNEQALLRVNWRCGR